MKLKKFLTAERNPYILPLAGAGFLLIWFIAYYPLSAGISRFVSVNRPNDTFLMFWTWREWMAGTLVKIFLRAEPFDLWKFVYFGILSNGRTPETGNITDIYLLSLPLRAVFGFPLYYNLKFLIILLFNALCGFHVIKKLTGRLDAAFLCGSFMVVNPAVLLILGKARLRVAIMGFLILYVYYIYCYHLNPSWKNACLAGVFLGAASLFYYFWAVVLAGITLLFFAGRLIFCRSCNDKTKPAVFVMRFSLCMLIPVLMILPWALPYINALAHYPEEITGQGVSLNQPVPLPSDVYSRNHGASPGISQALRRIFSESLPPGIHFNLLFIILIPFAFKKHRNFTFFLLICITGLNILCLGPYLKTSFEESANAFAKVGDSFIPLPYILFYRFVPFMSRLHHPDHLLIPATVMLMYAGGMGFPVLLDSVKEKNPRWSRYILPVALLSMVVNPAIYPSNMKTDLNEVHIPVFYRELSKEGFCGIIEVPIPKMEMEQVDLYDRYDLFQTVHNKKYIRSHWDGLLENIPLEDRFKPHFNGEFKKFSSNRLIRFLMDPEMKSLEKPTEDDLDQLSRAGYKYIIIHQRDCFEYLDRGKPDVDESASYHKITAVLKSLGCLEFGGTEAEKRNIFQKIGEEEREYEISIFGIKSR